MARKIGKQTYCIEHPVFVKNASSVVGPREKAGPLGKYFEEWEDEDLNSDELAYYIDVQARVSKKLLEIGQ